MEQTLGKKTASTKTERSERYRMKGEIKSEGQAMFETLQQLPKLGHQPSIEQHLARTNPNHFDQLFKLVDDEGFETVDYHKDTRLTRWLRGELLMPTSSNQPARSIEELLMCNLQLTSLYERYLLH
jgi:hypothetical protein